MEFYGNIMHKCRRKLLNMTQPTPITSKKLDELYLLSEQLIDAWNKLQDHIQDVENEPNTEPAVGVAIVMKLNLTGTKDKLQQAHNTVDMAYKSFRNNPSLLKMSNQERGAWFIAQGNKHN